MYNNDFPTQLWIFEIEYDIRSGAETGILGQNLINTIAANAQSSCVARNWAPMILTVSDK